MNLKPKTINLDIAGLGISFYSPSHAAHIAEGSNYLKSDYTAPEHVQRHIQKGTIVGFCTGTPGTFILKFHPGYPDEDYIANCDFKYRLGLHCIGGRVCFRDLYDLMEWDADCPSS